MTPERIVVVDDDPSVLKVVQTVLAAEGYDVEVAADGPEALRRILESPPALVILDVMMPGLNGWELCEIVRRQSHTREVPVLFLTGARTDVQDQITALQVGGSDHMSKPFRADELRAKTRALTRGRRRRARAR